MNTADVFRSSQEGVQLAIAYATAMIEFPLDFSQDDETLARRINAEAAVDMGALCYLPQPTAGHMIATLLAMVTALAGMDRETAVEAIRYVGIVTQRSIAGLPTDES